MTGPDGEFVFGGVPNGKWQIYCEDSETRGDWIRIVTAEVAGRDVNLDVVSAKLSTIRVQVEYEPGTQKWDITYANLQEGVKPWGIPVKKLTPPTKETDPYIVTNVPAGKYYLILMRQDYVAFRQSIEVNETDVNMTVRIPKGTSGIHGQLTGRYAAAMTLWTKDKTVIANLRPDPNFNYKLDNLPAGHYYVGGNMLIDSEAFIEFDLAEGETKDLDIVADAPKNQMSPLLILVLDENGVPLLGAKARLLSGVNAIEPIIDSRQGIYFMTEQGTYTLQVSFPGYKTATQQVSIEKFDPKNIQALRKPLIVRLER
jgi:hypothetical protein